MADQRIRLGSGRSDTLCTNCATTQSNLYTVYFNVDQAKLEVDKECVCYISGTSTKYIENYTVSTPQT